MAVRLKKRTILKFLLIKIPLFIFLVICLHAALDNYNLLFKSNQLELVKQTEKENPDFQDHQLELRTLNANFKQPRRNIVIVSHGRSGSTITGDIFNHHPFVFYLHEPLQTAERLSFRQRKKSEDSYVNLMVDVLTNIFRCNFSKSVVEDIEFFYRDPDHSRGSNAIGSPPLCPYEITDPRWDPKLCPPMTSKSLGSVCRNNYEITVTKILMNRIAEASMKNILAACSPSDIDCKIIFLIRDPRAVIPSARSVSFFRDSANDEGRKNLRQFTYRICQQTEKNLAFVKNLPNHWRNRIMIQRYEDFAMDPLKRLSRLFEFAGLPVLESVKTWLNKSTHLSNNPEVLNLCKGNHPAFCTVDDASAAVNRWRRLVRLCDIDIIEHYCKHVMWMMGYTPIERSYEIMSNTSVPLISVDYEAKGWFQE